MGGVDDATGPPATPLANPFATPLAGDQRDVREGKMQQVSPSCALLNAVFADHNF